MNGQIILDNTFLNTDHQAELSSHHRWSTLNRVAAIACAVALTAIAALAVVLTYITMPVYLPIAFTAVLIFALAPGYSAFSFFWGNAREHSEEAKALQPTVEELKGLEGKDLTAELQQEKIDVPQDPESLRDGLAVYKGQLLTIKQYTAVLEKMEGHFSDPAKPLVIKDTDKDGKSIDVHVRPKDYLKDKAEFHKDEEQFRNHRAVIESYKRVMQNRQNLAALKLSSAYTFHVLNNPEAKPLTELCSLVALSIEERLVKNAYEKSHDETLVYFGADGSESMSMAELIRSDVRDISKDVFGQTA